MAKSISPAAREAYRRVARHPRSDLPSQPERATALNEDANNLPIVLSIAILIVMTAVLIIDFHFNLGLSLLTLVVMGSVIAAIAVFG